MNLLFLNPTAIGKLTKKLVKVFIEAIKNWMEASSGERVYQTCLNTAKLKWRSSIEIALLDL
jgi:hypothetical protein